MWLLSRSVAFGLGLGLGIWTYGSVRGLVQRSGWRWCQRLGWNGAGPELGTGEAHMDWDPMFRY